MHCEHCHSHMNETRSEQSESSVQHWFKCSLCGRESMNSQPLLSRSDNDDADAMLLFESAGQRLDAMY